MRQWGIARQSCAKTLRTGRPLFGWLFYGLGHGSRTVDFLTPWDFGRRGQCQHATRLGCACEILAAAASSCDFLYSPGAVADEVRECGPCFFFFGEEESSSDVDRLEKLYGRTRCSDAGRCRMPSINERKVWLCDVWTWIWTASCQVLHGTAENRGLRSLLFLRIRGASLVHVTWSFWVPIRCPAWMPRGRVSLVSTRLMSRGSLTSIGRKFYWLDAT